MQLSCPRGHTWQAEVAGDCPECGSPAATRTLPPRRADLSSEERARLEQVLGRFEDAWQGGTPPALESLLTDCPELYDALLVELILIDLEYRWKAGESARVESYLARFESLRQVPALIDLIVREFELRGRFGNAGKVEEYCERFPAVAAELAQRLARVGEGASTLPIGAGGTVHAGWPTVPGFEVIGELGRGGMGVVYKAVQKATKRIVALKVMLQGPLASPRQQRRFEREIDLAAGLRHPGIVTIYDSGVTPQGLHYFAMEHIEGVSLDDHLRGGGPRGQRDLLRLFRKIGAAVAYAHQRGVIHRDLKPGNIRIDPEGEPHVFDFGLAKATGPDERDDAGHALTLSGEFLGTLAYTSPEQAAGELDQVDVRTDVYALGVVLYRMLTGEFPYPVTGRIQEVLRNIAETEPRRPIKTPAHERIDEALGALMVKALAKLPARRYQSASALVEDIDRYLAGEPLEARPASMSFLLRSWLRRNFQTTLAIVAIGLCCGVTGSLPRVLQRNRGLWADCARAAQYFPDLPQPPLARLANTLPPWLLRSSLLPFWMGYGALGLLTALLVRPSNRDEEVVSGIASGLVAGLAAFAFGGMGWSVVLAMYEDVVQPDLKLLSAGYRASGDPLGEHYPGLRELSPTEQAEAARLRIALQGVEKIPPSLVAVLVYALSLGGACGVVGTITTNALLRRFRKVRYLLIPYTMVAFPTMPLISGLLLWPAGVTDPLQVITRALLMGVALLGVFRDWPPRLLLPVYTAGVVALLEFMDHQVPGWLLASAAAIGALAIGAQAFRESPGETCAAHD